MLTFFQCLNSRLNNSSRLNSTQWSSYVVYFRFDWNLWLKFVLLTRDFDWTVVYQNGAGRYNRWVAWIYYEMPAGSYVYSCRSGNKVMSWYCYGQVFDNDNERMDLVRNLRKKRASSNTVVVHERKGKRFECGFCEYESRAQYIIARHVARVHQKNIKPTKCSRLVDFLFLFNYAFVYRWKY